MEGLHSLTPQSVESFEAVSKPFLKGYSKLLRLEETKGPVIPRREWNFLFGDLYKVCIADDGKYLEELRHTLQTILKDHIEELRKLVMNAKDSELLRVYRDCFERFHSRLETAELLFEFQLYKSEANKFDSGRDAQGHGYSSHQIDTFLAIGMAMWRTEIFEPIRTAIYSSVYDIIDKDRNGQVADMGTAQAVIESYVKFVVVKSEEEELTVELSLDNDGLHGLHYYCEEFENRFLQETKDYYTREMSLAIQTLPCSEYLVKANQRLDDEILRAKKLLHSTSEAKITAVCDDCMIVQHREILESNFLPLVENRDIVSLQLLFGLLQRLDVTCKGVRKILENYIAEEGQRKIRMLNPKTSGSSLPGQYVELLTEFGSKYRKLIKEAFSDSVHFYATLDTSCRIIVNNSKFATTHAPQVPDILAKYCDDCLRKSSKHMGDGDFEERLSDLINIFTYMDDKDVFQKVYSKLLAKRLIHNTSVSEDAEESMLSKLKRCCGYDYTSKLQQMFTDIKLSTTLNSRFSKTELGGSVASGFRALVLQSGAWPLGQGHISSFNLSVEQERCVTLFAKFYDSEHSGRKLTWLHHLSMGDLIARLKSQYEFGVTTFQMGVLLLYNNADMLTVASIAERTNLSERELNRTLRSLVSCKLLLSCTDIEASGNIPGEYELTLNMNFKSKKKKVKISSAIQKETPQEAKKLHDSVVEDRKLFLQAAIVRIMKMRKVLSYNLLLTETIDLASARFMPTVSNIKRAIEDLIDKQFLERSGDNKNELHYLA